MVQLYVAPADMSDLARSRQSSWITQNHGILYSSIVAIIQGSMLRTVTDYGVHDAVADSNAAG